MSVMTVCHKSNPPARQITAARLRELPAPYRDWEHMLTCLQGLVAWAADGGNACRITVLETTLQGDLLRAEFRVFVRNGGGDPRRGGRVSKAGGVMQEYIVEARRTGGTLGGSWRSASGDPKREGQRTGRVTFAQTPPKTYVAPAVGEHPCLLIRKGDIPALRKKAETEWDRKTVERLKKDDPCRTNTAVGRALLHAGNVRRVPPSKAGRAGGEELLQRIAIGRCALGSATRSEEIDR